MAPNSELLPIPLKTYGGCGAFTFLLGGVLQHFSFSLRVGHTIDLIHASPFGAEVVSMDAGSATNISGQENVERIFFFWG
jgi:hypothetical protein